MQRLTHVSCIAVLASVLAMGCDVSTTGNQGAIAFTPDECGHFAGCNFANPIGVGGSLLAHISGIDGVSTVGIDLEASDPQILAVSPTGDIGGQPTWQLVGLAEGPVSILAVDAERQVVDFIDVSVVLPGKLMMENMLGEAVGPTADAPGFDERWIVNTNERAVFYVVAAQEDETPVLGQYGYTYAVDPGLMGDVTDPDSLSLGRLDITPTTPGQYSVVFESNAGHSIAVLIDVQDTL